MIKIFVLLCLLLAIRAKQEQQAKKSCSQKNKKIEDCDSNNNQQDAITNCIQPNDCKELMNEYKLSKGLKIISVLGGPGSGKGTQCTYLVQHFGFHHISSGDLFRNQIKQKGPLSQQIQSYIKQGMLVPSNIGVKLILQQLTKYKENDIILLDGFPRNKQNLQAWNQLVKDYKLQTFLHLQCPIQVMFQRLVQRGGVSGRTDDNPDTIRKRLEIFKKETQEIIDQLVSSKDSFVIKIDTDKQVGEVSKEVHQKFIQAGFETKEQNEQL